MEKLLTQVCKVQYGFPFDSSKFSASSGIPVIRIRDVVRGYSETFTTEDYSEEFVVNNGDMLVGMDGEFNIGKWNGGKALLNQRVCRLLPTSQVEANYLFYFMPKVLKEIEAATPFATVKHLSAKQINKIVIPLPLVEEQKIIAQKFLLVDELIALRKEQLEKLDQLVKSRFIELSNGGKCSPIRMGDIATYVNGFAFKPTHWKDSGRPIIRIQNLNDPNAKYNYFDGCIDEKYLVHNGDVLISWATHLEAYIWKGSDAWVNQHIFKVVFDKAEIDKTYFVYATEDALRQAFKYAHGFKPTMEHIKRSDFENAVVSVPELSIQKQFAAFVAETDKLKLAATEALTELETLKKSLMQEYFG